MINIKYSYILSSFLLISFSTQARHRSSFFQEMDQMLEHLDSMHQQLQTHMRHMSSHNTFDTSVSWYSDFLVNDQKENAVITLKGIETEKVDASWQDEDRTLTILTDVGKIIIEGKGNHLSITLSQDKKEKLNEKGYVSAHHFFAQESHAKRLSSPIKSLEYASIGYAKEDKTLTITIPKLVRSSKQLPVSIQ